MGDLWNPFDANNPVYASLAKELKASRKRTRNGVLILITLGIIATSTQSGLFGINGRVNQFGVIHRK